MSNEGGSRAGASAGLQIVEIIAYHQDFRRRDLPLFANEPQPVWRGLERGVFTGNDRVKMQSAAIQHSENRAPRVAAQQPPPKTLRFEPFHALFRARVQNGRGRGGFFMPVEDLPGAR